MSGGPLRGLRVIDVTDDTGRFATKLLAELGASVVSVLPRAGTTPGPAMVAPAAMARGGLLDWWFEGGKPRVDASLDQPEGVEAFRQLARRADLIVETEPPGRLAALDVDHQDLVTDNSTLVQVSLTPFGRTGPRSGWQTTDL